MRGHDNNIFTINGGDLPDNWGADDITAAGGMPFFYIDGIEINYHPNNFMGSAGTGNVAIDTSIWPDLGTDNLGECSIPQWTPPAGYTDDTNFKQLCLQNGGTWTNADGWMAIQRFNFSYWKMGFKITLFDTDDQIEFSTGIAIRFGSRVDCNNWNP